MKKRIILPIAVALLAVLLVLFAACGGDTPAPDVDGTTSPTVTDADKPDDSDESDQPSDPESTGQSVDSEDPADTDAPDEPTDTEEPSYDETPPCEAYWYYEPIGEIGKLVKVSYDEKGSIHLIEKYPLFSEILHNNAYTIEGVSLSDIAYNDPFGNATEKVTFNYRDGTLVSADYYSLSRHHLGDRTYKKGYTVVIEEADLQSSFRYATAYVSVNGYKTILEDTFTYDSANKEILRRSSVAAGSDIVYDTSGRLIAVRGNRDGSLLEYGRDGNVSAWKYMVTGFVEKEMRFTFTNGNLSALTYIDGEETYAATLTYDAEGRFARAEIAYTNAENPAMNAEGVCSVAYDASSRVLETVLTDVRDGEITARSYTYTAEGYFATIRDVVSYTPTGGGTELISYGLTYKNGKPVSITKNTRLGTYTSKITYDVAGNLTYDGNFTYEYYASGHLKKRSNENGYTVYYENGLPKEAKYPGIERSTVVNYFDEIPFHFAFHERDLYFGTQNETSFLVTYAKRTVHTEADGTVTEYVRTFDEHFNVIDTVTTVTPPSGDTPSEETTSADTTPEDTPPAHTHAYTRSEITTPATCEKDGELTKYCSCGESITQIIRAKGHDYDHPAVTTQPTCTVSGVVTISCDCGAYVTETIEPLGHDIIDEVLTRQPTCDEVGQITKYCYHGCTVYEDVEALGHSFRDWSVFTEPTCVTEGVLIRSCETCYGIEYDTAPVIDHDYRRVIEQPNENGRPTVSLACVGCDAPAGRTYLGSYLDTNEIFYLTDQPTDFSFVVLSDCDIETVRQAVVLVDVFFVGASEEEVRNHAVETTVTEVDDGRYLVVPTTPLDENTTYGIVLYDYNGDVCFSDMPGHVAIFDTAGDAVDHVEYNKDVLFLKALAAEKGIEYAYSLEYSDEHGMYILILPDSYGITEDHVGKILCIGDCTSFDEADGLSSDEIFMGKIEVVLSENGLTGIGLSIPSVLDIYTAIEVSDAGIQRLDKNIVTDEVKESALRSVVESDDFAGAIAAANIAARNYAAEHYAGAYTLPRDLNLDGFTLTSKVEEIDDNAVKITLYITYAHVIELLEGDIHLGDITFTVSFEMSNTFTLDVSTNLSEYLTDSSTPMMFMKCQVTTTTYAAFDMEVNISMNYSESDEAIFIVNVKTLKIHLPSCKHCPKILSDHYVAMTLSELAAADSHYENYECKVCRPFSLDSSAFYVNRDSWIVHVKSCFYLRNMDPDHYLAYSMYPVDKGVKNCTTCHPEQYTKTLAQHVGKSLEDEDFAQAFESVKKAAGELLTMGGESPIDEDTDPKILIPIACFEVPIYLEPKFDFNLKANFAFHTDVTAVSTTMLALIYRDGEYSIIGDCHSEKPVATTTVDIMGELDVEIGVITEIRFGLRYLSKYVYVGLMMDTGVYLDAGGVFSYNSIDDLAYYAASLELGVYAEARCTYAIIGLIPADSIYILDKTHFPVFNSGDTRVYFRYENTEEIMEIVNVRKLWLDNTYLMCNYYDLKKMDVFKGSLSWNGSAQYGISCVFRDENGNEVDYITFENGAVIIRDDAPDTFTVYMTVTVEDRIVYDNITEYFGTANKNGYAIFLSEKVIEIRYSYTDTTEEMQNALDVYKGTYSFGTDLFGTVFYRNLTLGVHSTKELCADEGMLNAYAIFATYSLRDERGNPVKVYTADDLRSVIQSMGCEYVMVFYASPGNHYNDEGYEFKIVQAYWDGGLYSNSANQMEIGGNSESSVYLDLGAPNEEGLFGGVYADGNLSEQIGKFELIRTSGAQNNVPAE